MQYLESDGSNFEIYSVTDRKPVEIRENRRNMAKARFLGNDPSKCVLDKLQASQNRNRRASQERVTVVASLEPTIAAATVLQASVVKEERMWRSARMWK